MLVGVVALTTAGAVGCGDDADSTSSGTGASGTGASGTGADGSGAAGAGGAGTGAGGASTGGTSTGGSGTGGAGGVGGTGTGGSGGSNPTAMSFFVSSSSPSANADGNLGGLAGADAHCKALAMAVNAERTEWVAYLSAEGDPNTTADDTNAIDRIGSGPWYNADEVMFAADLDAIHTIETAIIACASQPPSCIQDRDAYILVKPSDTLFLDELGVQVTDPLQGGGRGHDIFTGSQPDGAPFPGGTCSDWTSSSQADFARVGHTDAPSNTDFSPSWNSAHDTVDCSTGGVEDRGGAGFVYCFATD